MSELFVGLDIVRVYIDDLLHVTKGSWTENLSILEEMFTRLQKAGLKVNVRKSCIGANKFYYLCYHVTHDGVMTIPKNSRPFKPSQFQKLANNCVSSLL